MRSGNGGVGERLPYERPIRVFLNQLIAHVSRNGFRWTESIFSKYFPVLSQGEAIMSFVVQRLHLPPESILCLSLLLFHKRLQVLESLEDESPKALVARVQCASANSGVIQNICGWMLGRTENSKDPVDPAALDRTRKLLMSWMDTQATFYAPEDRDCPTRRLFSTLAASLRFGMMAGVLGKKDPPSKGKKTRSTAAKQQ